jgi:hypothetical protein
LLDLGKNFHSKKNECRILEEVNNIDNKCQHCHRVGHLESQFFYLHPCLHRGKTNHLSEKFRKKKKVKQTIDYDWISSWKWNKQVNNMHKSYHLVHTQVKTHLHGEMTKEKRFQTTIPDDFGHDSGPILHVF